MSGHRVGWLRAVAVVVPGAAAFALLLVLVYSRQSTLALTTERGVTLPSSGFYPVEGGPGSSYMWTRPRAEITIPDLDRRVEWRLTAVTRSFRPADSPPTVRVAVDGVMAGERTMAASLDNVQIVMPRRPVKSGATITIDVSPTFIPGAGDPRELGIAIESLTLAPLGGVPMPPLRSVLVGAVAVALLGIMLAASGLAPGWAVSLVIFAAVAQASLFVRGMALHGHYPIVAAALAAGVGGAGWLLSYGLEASSGRPWSPAAHAVVAVSSVACFLKLLVLLHPAAALGDGVFHAHRFEYVLDGRLYFTSVAPGGYAFPYPVLLYLISAPFSFLAHNTLERLSLLRVVVTAADAAAGAMLYWAIVRATSNRPAGVLAVVWYHLIPMTAWIMTWGNLTNAFGQALFVASLVNIVALPVNGTKRSLAVLTQVSTGALLSHPSTCAILIIVLLVAAGLYAVGGTASLRETSVSVATAAFAAGTVALIVYYAWFPAVYARELTRIVSESSAQLFAHAAESPVGGRLASIPALAAGYLGWPAILAAAVGAYRIGLEVQDMRLVRLLAAWVVTCVAFLALGVVTPVQMRTHFALFPALAIAAAFACAWGWRQSAVSQAVVAGVVGWAAWIGVRQWIGLFG